METTLFTKIIEGEVPCHKVWENESFFAFLDVNPINPGHTLVIPKKETDYLFDLNDIEYSALFLAAKKLALVLKKATQCERVGLAVEGFMIPHVHIHLVPLNEGNGLNPEKAKKATEEELVAMAEKIKASF
jgi:histidine triad (HIT) family protein